MNSISNNNSNNNDDDDDDDDDDEFKSQLSLGSNKKYKSKSSMNYSQLIQCMRSISDIFPDDVYNSKNASNDDWKSMYL